MDPLITRTITSISVKWMSLIDRANRYYIASVEENKVKREHYSQVRSDITTMVE